MKIFYSWQSDSPNNTNRSFIRNALEAAVEMIGDDTAIDDAERPEVDEATKNTKGMIDIRESILRKISDCQIYVADLTPIARTKARKAVPNPNVMYETGWASNKPGYDFIVGIVNTHKNKGPAELPFDLRGRRILTYCLAPDANSKTRGDVRNQLIKALAGAIRDNIAGVAQKMSDENPINPAPHDDQDFSLWGVGNNRHILVPDSFGAFVDVSILDGARAYARIVPASWLKPVPHALDIRDATKKVEADSTGRSAGSYGTCEVGFIRYWFDSDPDNRSHLTGAAALYLEDYGEYWCISDGPFLKRPKGLIVSPPRILKFWKSSIIQALELFDELGASKRRLIEVGVTGMARAYLSHTGQFYETPQSRKPHVRRQQQHPVWEGYKIADLLRLAYDDLLLAFSQSKATDELFDTLYRR